MLVGRCGRLTVALALASSTGCAQISSTSEVSLIPTEGEEQVIGASGGWELDRNYGARWVQMGNQIAVELWEHRACQEILHAPVVRVEKITRRADATLVWEFLVAGALAGFAIFAFTKPEAFGGRYVDGGSGEVVTNTAPGYRTGGIFIGIAGIMFASGVYDVARARDETIYTDAYELRPGQPVACAEPTRPVAERSVTLVVGDHESEGVTDAAGRVRLQLPPETSFARPDQRMPDKTVNAAVKIDRNRAVRVDFRLPYNRRLGETHTGSADPGPPEDAQATGEVGSEDVRLLPGTPPAKAHQRELERDKEATGDAGDDRPGK